MGHSFQDAKDHGDHRLVDTHFLFFRWGRIGLLHLQWVFSQTETHNLLMNGWHPSSPIFESMCQLHTAYQPPSSREALDLSEIQPGHCVSNIARGGYSGIPVQGWALCIQLRYFNQHASRRQGITATFNHGLLDALIVNEEKNSGML